MPDWSSIYVPWAVGLLSAWLACIPVGPINVTIINEGARRGFRWAVMIGLGAVVAELIYCTIAFAGFASFFGNRLVKAFMELSSFVFMLYLGIKFLRAKEIEGNSRVEEKIERKLHPHSAFMIGFIRVGGNPGILLFWIVLAANFISRDWVEPNGVSKLACITGVGLGSMTWFMGLSYAVSLGHKKFTDKTLLKMEHISGISLLVLALFHGGRIIYQMAHHKL